jgi:hypothetical protein
MNLLDIQLRYAVNYVVRDSKIESTVSTKPVAHGRVDTDRVAPDLKDKMPAGVHVGGSLPVTVEVDRSTLASKILSRLSAVPMDIIYVVIVWLLRRMVLLSAAGTPESPANPFVWANVRRLRVIAALMLIMPVIDSWSHIAQWELVSRSLPSGMSVLSWDASDIFLELGVGMLLLLLAEVFASGIRLREDVEGLV